MEEESSNRISDHFGANLAQVLADKICAVYPAFNGRALVQRTAAECGPLLVKARVALIADTLAGLLPDDYPTAVDILMRILGPENPKETGMFKHWYWLTPVAKYIEQYGLDHFDLSLHAIGEVTKRNTGEYAIRPYIQRDPAKALPVIDGWAQSPNFHLRGLASEGLRPKLPWAPKLDLFIQNPTPVFAILEHLRHEPIKFVKKSVANHITDYLKVNPAAAWTLLDRWKTDPNPHTQWMVWYATRKL